MDIIKKIEQENMKAEKPEFNVGDTVKVHVRVIEGKRERIQIFILPHYSEGYIHVEIP